MKNLEEVQELWDDFGNICIDEEERIDSQFLHFPVGTDRMVIWHWFESEFDLSIVEDLH